MKNARSYVFVLGRNADISVAEIKAVCNAHNWTYEEVLKTREVYIVDSDNLDANVLHKTLGGTVKIGEVVSVSHIDSIEETLDFALLSRVLATKTGKVQFGISIYDGGVMQGVEYLDRALANLCKSIKRELRSQDMSVRFAHNTERFLSSVVVTKDKLIEKGAEILLIPSTDGVIIGKTLSVQEFEAFSDRDYGRPVRDMKSGVMPPKLARMMINLSEIASDKVLLDPFCGSGTMLQEAILLGFSNVLGRDVSSKAIEDSRVNMEWLTQANSNIQAKIDIKQADVARLSSDLKIFVSVIVTEPYLGPTLHREPTRGEFEKVERQLKELYLGAFKEFKKILDKDGVVVFILPAFMRFGKVQYMDIISGIEKLGFKQEVLSENNRGSIIYGNKYDFVLREIVKFKKSK